MKSIQIIIYLLLISNTFFAQDKATSTQDSIKVFYADLFNELEQNYLYKDSVNWNQLKPYITKEALKANSFYEALEMCPVLFDSIKGDHTLLFTEKKLFNSTLKKS